MNIHTLTFVSLINSLFTTCSTKKFFQEWEKESNEIISSPLTSDLEKNIQELSNILFCSDKGQKYPHIENVIINETIKVSVTTSPMTHPDFMPLRTYSDSTIVFGWGLAKYEIRDSLFYNRPNCDSTQLTPLHFTNTLSEYLIGKPQSRVTKIIKARVAKRNNINYLEPPVELETIIFNSLLDTAIVGIGIVSSFLVKRYIKTENAWKYDTTISRMDE